MPAAQPMYLLDTNVLSELTKPRPELVVTRRIYATSRERVFASEMSRYELRYGARLKGDSGQLWQNIVERVVPIPIWLPVEAEVSHASGDLDATLKLAGRPIGLADVCIAATALVYDLVLVTRNRRHFDAIPGLTVENWFPDGAAAW